MPEAAAQPRERALLRAPSPDMGQRQQITRRALPAPIQQRFLLNNVLNHMFKRALMDVSMASSILLSVSVGRKKDLGKVWCRV